MSSNNDENHNLQKINSKTSLKKFYNNLKKYRNIVLRVMDILIVAVAYVVADMLVNKTFPSKAITNPIVLTSIVVAALVYVTTITLFNLYKNITRYENGNDYLQYVVACLVAYGITSAGSMLVVHHFVDFQTNMVAALMIVAGFVGYRVVIRLILSGDYKTINSNAPAKKKVLVIGAGSATTVILKILQSTLRSAYEVVGVIDDNLNKVDHVILGAPVLGTRYDIPRVCRENKIDMIFFSISNISNKDKKDILTICQETGCKVRILPGTEDIIKNGNSIMGNFRDVEIEDLLGRETIKLDNTDIAKEVENKVVMVTGGGGSIGSELCRQIIKFNPAKLIIVDIYENNLYEIEQELRINYPENNNVRAVVASVRDKKRLNEIFDKYRPYLVFHAAAHKHVPLMEVSPLEAIKNNVFGTYNTVNCADEYGVKKFVLISTDKAVNPTNIMGATKRLCEMIIQAKSKVSKTQYAAVRFGNVLGSNGSVIPLFKKQIAKGGPITVMSAA